MSELNDSLDDLFNGPIGDVRAVPVRAPATYTPKLYAEPCSKCRGSGSWQGRGRCFACNGAGKQTFKTSPEARAKSHAASIQRKADREQEALKAFEETHPAVYAWLKANCACNEFAGSVWGGLHKFGSLTDGQRGAVERIIARNAERAAEAAKRAEQAPEVDTAAIDRLKLAFDTAIANARARGRGLRAPRITIGSIVISPAGAASKNPGALYVKDTGTYLGKVSGGKFFASRECDPDQEQKVLSFIADPKAAAVAYGKETGVCCVCNATLTNKESIEAGIGPICAENWGW